MALILHAPGGMQGRLRLDATALSTAIECRNLDGCRICKLGKRVTAQFL